jgi:hypothetical protein
VRPPAAAAVAVHAAPYIRTARGFFSFFFFAIVVFKRLFYPVVYLVVPGV